MNETERAPSSRKRRVATAQVLRFVAMLQMLPAPPKRISTTAIRQRLAALGFHTTARTVQRDLLLLQGAFPIEYDPRQRPYAWQWARDADPHPLPTAIDASPVRIVALVSPWIVRRLGEVESQSHHDGRRRVTLTVSGGPALRRWVLGFGEHMEVLEPASLRRELRDAVHAMTAFYGD